jgi:transposase
MKLYAGIDLHSNNSVLVILNEADKVVYERRLPNQLPVILSELAPYKKEVQAIAIESTYNWYWLVDGLMEEGYEIKLVNTAAVKVYEGLKYTGDEHDARHLAHLLRLGVLPTGHIHPKGDRAVRDLLRKRGQLVRYRTMQILSIQATVSRNVGHGLSTEEVRKLDDAEINQLCGGDAARALAIKSNLATLRCLDAQIAEVEAMALQKAKLRPEFKKLLTVDGIWEILGMTIMYEAGDMDRFKKVGHFASYARCVNSTRWTNGKKKGEGNRKNGNKYLAWAFIEAAHYAVRYNERIRKFYQRKQAKTNKVVAAKAVAHKLARACYHVLKEQVRFDETRAFA